MMGARGPAPTPTAVLNARGSKQRYKRGPEPEITPGAPVCPEWLVGYAKERWDYIVPRLVGAGVLSEVDQDALAEHCETMREWFEQRGTLKPREHLAYMETLSRQRQQFGLTPSARARLAKPPAKKMPAGKDRFFVPRIVK